MLRLDGKTAFITGAASGIGAETARLFAAQGANCIIADVDEANGRDLGNELGNLCPFRRVDVTDGEDVKAAMDFTVDRFGSLDVLINNAGIGLVGNVEETSDHDFERLMHVNVHGLFNCCRHAIPYMVRQKRGNIINIGSVAGMVGIERRFAYSASKGAVIAITRQLAIDYVGSGIRVNCVSPGTVYTPFVQGYLNRFHSHELEETTQKLNARQPMGRMGRPDEIAKAALYLAADESEFVTGSILTIDGGLTAR